MRRIVSALICLPLLACTTLSGSQPVWPPGLPPEALVAGVPVVEQEDADTCGPAAMAMVLAWAGEQPDIETLTEQMLTPGRHGTLQLDMVGVARRHGRKPRELNGFAALLSEVGRGRPVIVLENLRVSWWPQWHYAVVTGYDARAGTLRLHAGGSTAETVEVETFLGRWQDADYWGLVVPRR